MLALGCETVLTAGACFVAYDVWVVARPFGAAWGAGGGVGEGF